VLTIAASTTRSEPRRLPTGDAGGADVRSVDASATVFGARPQGVGLNPATVAATRSAVPGQLARSRPSICLCTPGGPPIGHAPGTTTSHGSDHRGKAPHPIVNGELADQDADVTAEPGGDTLLRHGYTVADLERLARKAAFASRWRFLPLSERRDIARFAIVEHLLTTPEGPEYWFLVSLGETAIWAHVEKEGRYRGRYIASSHVEPGTGMPRFHRYWTTAAQPTRSPEDRIVDVMALKQIWSRLSRPHQAVLLALAAHDDYQVAAASLGREYHGFVSTVSTARQQFLRLWHQHETPSRVWGRHRPNTTSRAESRKSITAITIRRRERRRHARLTGVAP
jgi:hypothetical protein